MHLTIYSKFLIQNQREVDICGIVFLFLMLINPFNICSAPTHMHTPVPYSCLFVWLILTHIHLVPHICVIEVGSALVRVMACRMFGAKPLPELMLAYCRLDPWEHISVKNWIGILSFSFKKMLLKLSSAKVRPFCPGGEGGDKIKSHLWSSIPKET